VLAAEKVRREERSSLSLSASGPATYSSFSPRELAPEESKLVRSARRSPLLSAIVVATTTRLRQMERRPAMAAYDHVVTVGEDY
jgi:hypothetical protein